MSTMVLPKLIVSGTNLECQSVQELSNGAQGSMIFLPTHNGSRMLIMHTLM